MQKKRNYARIGDVAKADVAKLSVRQGREEHDIGGKSWRNATTQPKKTVL